MDEQTDRQQSCIGVKHSRVAGHEEFITLLGFFRSAKCKETYASRKTTLRLSPRIAEVHTSSGVKLCVDNVYLVSILNFVVLHQGIRL